jgi:ribosome-binding factor A
MSELRLKKVESLLQHEISLLIIGKKIKDPRVTTFLNVSRVSVSRDLNYAKVWISSFETPKTVLTGVEGLNHAAGYIQKEIAKGLHMRFTPKLTFIADFSIKEGFEINKLIEEIEN